RLARPRLRGDGARHGRGRRARQQAGGVAPRDREGAGRPPAVPAGRGDRGPPVRRLAALFQRVTRWLRIRDKEGTATGFLASTAPAPSQASLDAAFGGVVRVRVIDWEEARDKTYARTRLLAEIADAASIARLRQCLRIDE